jgi:micrococcal nuclease
MSNTTSHHLRLEHPRDQYVYACRLVRIIDGDTVVLDIDLGCDVWLHKQHCRLFGINSPEPHTTTKDAGNAATAWLHELLYGTRELLVRTYYDRTDSFRRLLVELWADGHNINYCMVQDGHAVLLEAKHD